jgi:hypothetical protein
MYGFDKSGDINVMTGLARYPNRNITDAYAMVTRRDGLAVIRPVSMLSETLREVRMDGNVGHRLAEMVFMGAYARYGYTGW